MLSKILDTKKREYYFELNDERSGPFFFNEIKAMINKNQIPSNTRIIKKKSSVREKKIKGLNIKIGDIKIISIILLVLFLVIGLVSMLDLTQIIASGELQ